MTEHAEYYPGAIHYFFDKVLAGSARRGGAFERLLSSDPLPQDRMENVRKIMKEMAIRPPHSRISFNNDTLK